MPQQGTAQGAKNGRIKKEGETGGMRNRGAASPAGMSTQLLTKDDGSKKGKETRDKKINGKNNSFRESET